jgi:hypothetical protein
MTGFQLQQPDVTQTMSKTKRTLLEPHWTLAVDVLFTIALSRAQPLTALSTRACTSEITVDASVLEDVGVFMRQLV